VQEQDSGTRSRAGTVTETPDSTFDTQDESAANAGGVTETVDKAKEKAMDTADQAKDKAAEGMDSAAEMVREKLGAKSGVTGTAGTKLAEGMEKTAGYLKEHDTQDMMNDLDTFVREHPTQALIGAVAIGFVLGRMLR
jgi:ElaB/YqjD/DUF883 family membrane-anchored ribosome-binding protein